MNKKLIRSFTLDNGNFELSAYSKNNENRRHTIKIHSENVQIDCNTS